MIYTRVVGAMAAAVLLKAFLWWIIPPEVLHIEVHGVHAFLGVVGGLYGIIVAFLIFVVWDQFNRVQMEVAKEASAHRRLERLL